MGCFNSRIKCCVGRGALQINGLLHVHSSEVFTIPVPPSLKDTNQYSSLYSLFQLSWPRFVSGSLLNVGMREF